MDLFGVSSSIRIGFLAISCYISERNKMVLIPSLLIPLKQPGLQLLQGYGTLKLPESPRPNGPARHPPLSAAAGSVRLAAGRCQSPWGRPRWPNEAHGSPRWWSQGVGMSIGLRGTMSKLKMLKHWTYLNLISLASWLSSNKGTYRGCRTQTSCHVQTSGKAGKLAARNRAQRSATVPLSDPRCRTMYEAAGVPKQNKNRNTRQHRASSRAPLNITSKAPAMGRNNYNNDNKNKNQKETPKQQTFRV